MRSKIILIQLIVSVAVFVNCEESLEDIWDRMYWEAVGKSTSNVSKIEDFNTITSTEATTPKELPLINDVMSSTNGSQEPINTSCGGTCVPYYLCTQNNELNTDGLGLIDVRFTDDEKKCPKLLDVCCGEPYVLPSIQKPPPKVFDKCGVSNSDGIGIKIIGSDHGEAQYGEFPWMMAILTVTELKHTYLCGGSLIHPQVVLTSAHNIALYKSSVQSIIVRGGEWDLLTDKEEIEHQDRVPSEIIIHNKYNKQLVQFDMALIILESPMELTKTIQTVCLPPENFWFDSDECYVAGWGKNTFGAVGNYIAILKKIQLPIVPNRKCQEDLGKTRLGPYFRLHSSFICAGGIARKDVCTGDGGSPLVCPIAGASGQYYQAGIVSWGIGCGEINRPGVYTSVSRVRKWIDRQIRAIGANDKYYNFQPATIRIKN